MREEAIEDLFYQYVKVLEAQGETNQVGSLLSGRNQAGKQSRPVHFCMAWESRKESGEGEECGK